MSRLSLFVPLGIFLLLAAMFYLSFDLDSGDRLPSAMLGQQFPAFAAPILERPEETATEAVLKGQVSLVNVWATWCPTCKAEHAFLEAVHQDTGIPIVGINYKDNAEKALAWLAEYGNPYVLNLFDPTGRLGIELGVYGAPETFLVDAEGRIVFKWVGELNDRIWQRDFVPLLTAMGAL